MIRRSLFAVVAIGFLAAALFGCTRIDEVTPTATAEQTATPIPQSATAEDRPIPTPTSRPTQTPNPPSSTSISFDVQYECVVGLQLEIGEACAYESDDGSRFVLALLEDGSTLLDGDVGPLSLSGLTTRPGGKVCACGLETEWDGNVRTITALPEPIPIPDMSGIEAWRDPYPGHCESSMTLLPGELCRYTNTYCYFEVTADGQGSFMGLTDFEEIRVDSYELDSVTIDFAADAVHGGWVIRQTQDWRTAPRGHEAAPCVVEPLTAELHAAIRSQDAAAVRLLLEAGADVNGRNKYGDPPLESVIWGSFDPEMARILIDAGADMEKRDNNGNTLIHNAVYRDTLRELHFLIDAGADINALDGDGAPLLFSAVRENNIELMHYLLERGVDINARGWGGYTVLVGPLFDDDIEKISMLLQAGADINARFADGDPVAEIAMRPYQADETLQFLIGAGVDIHAYGEGAPVWWAALQQGPTSKLRILLDAGVNPNACALWGVTALQRAIER